MKVTSITNVNGDKMYYKIVSRGGKMVKVRISKDKYNELKSKKRSSHKRSHKRFSHKNKDKKERKRRDEKCKSASKFFAKEMDPKIKNSCGSCINFPQLCMAMLADALECEDGALIEFVMSCEAVRKIWCNYANRGQFIARAGIQVSKEAEYIANKVCTNIEEKSQQEKQRLETENRKRAEQIQVDYRTQIQNEFRRIGKLITEKTADINLGNKMYEDEDDLWKLGYEARLYGVRDFNTQLKFIEEKIKQGKYRNLTDQELINKILCASAYEINMNQQRDKDSLNRAYKALRTINVKCN